MQRTLLVPGAIGEREHCFDRIEPHIKYGDNPVLEADSPWESETIGNPCALYSQSRGIYQMWYEAIGPALPPDSPGGRTRRTARADNWELRANWYIGYAESEDGFVWRKPSVGIMLEDLYPGNNIVHRDSGFLGGMISVIEDTEDPDPDRRYKMMVYDNDGDGRDGVRTAVSPDGIHFVPIGGFPVLPSQDTIALWHDRRRGRYVAFLKARVDNRRARLVSWSEDFERWSDPEPLLAPDIGDAATLQFYAQSAFHHHCHDFGLLGRFDLSTQTSDIELVTATGGIGWRRLPTRPGVLGPGDPGCWDAAGVYIAGNTPWNRDGRMWYPYAGTSRRHDGTTFTGEARAAIGLASFAPGRLCGQQFEGSGFFTTLPIKCPGGRLLIDADVSGSLQVALLGPGYRGEIEGFDAACSQVTQLNPTPPETTSRTSAGIHRVGWNDSFDLDSLAGSYVRIRVSGANSIVYGLEFSESEEAR